MPMANKEKVSRRRRDEEAGVGRRTLQAAGCKAKGICGRGALPRYRREAPRGQPLLRGQMTGEIPRRTNGSPPEHPHPVFFCEGTPLSMLRKGEKTYHIPDKKQRFTPVTPL